MMSLLIPDARAALTTYADLTALVPSSKISFSQRAQGQLLPGIIMNLGNVDYESTTGNAIAVTTYRVDYLTYADSAQVAANIHDHIKEALLDYTSSHFTIRLFDELYFVDTDLIHRTTVSALFEYSPGT